MKRALAAAVILLILTVGSSLHIRKMNQISDSLTAEILRSLDAYQEENRPLAVEKLYSAMRFWHEADMYTHIFLSHEDIQRINDEFYDILLILSDGSDAEHAYQRLLENLTQICLDEQPRLESIL